MLKVKVYIQSQDVEFGQVLADLLAGANCVIVSAAAEAHYVVSVGQQDVPGAGKYGIGSATRSAIGDGATTFNTGDISGDNVVIGSTQTVTGNFTINSTKQTQNELDGLLHQLAEVLAAAPPEYAQAATEVQTQAAAVVEEARRGESKTITRENLLKAATNIAAVMPTVGVIVGQIFGILVKLGG